MARLATLADLAQAEAGDEAARFRVLFDWGQRIEAGDHSAAAEAEAWARREAAGGNPEHITSLAGLLLKLAELDEDEDLARGRVLEAVALLDHSADLGCEIAAQGLVMIGGLVPDVIKAAAEQKRGN